MPENMTAPVAFQTSEAKTASAESTPKRGRSGGSIALDQWRGLALVLVLISHGLFFTGHVSGIGRVGVNLFFFISGILVYRSLNKEGESAFQLSKSFWRRRLRRLYPALAGYVVVMLVAVFFLQRVPTPFPNSDFNHYIRAVPFALIYGINYLADHPRSLGHLWSLGCEMQFYALAPALYLLGRGSQKRKYLVYGGLAFLAAAVGMIIPVRLHNNYEDIKYHFEIAAWPMFLGFFCEFIKKWFLRIPQTIVRVIFYVSMTALVGTTIAMLFGLEMKNLVIALGAVLLLPCLLAYLFGMPFSGAIGRSLAWLGERTYSIYLWQQPLTICYYLPQWLTPLGALVSIIPGHISFNLLEKPFLTESRAKQLKVLEANEPATN